MNITKKGQTVALVGEPPKVGEKSPDFQLLNLKKQVIQLSDLLGKPILISVVPDIDTRVCSIQTKRFNQLAGELATVQFLTISNNTREEQEHWCAAEGVDMQMLHDPENHFGESYRILIPELNRYARAIFVLDQTGKIVYEEIVPEMSQEPDYQQALAVASAL